MEQRTATRTVVIAGNPNTGKSTLFNQLTGGRVKVGNYPGVTVSRHSGRIRLPGLEDVLLHDSPGTYSLSARAADERIALMAIAGLPPCEPPDLVVAVVDATQLYRNLYLVLQIIELDLPVVVALNMTDMLEKSGQAVDAAALARRLGVPVVPIVARRGQGIAALGGAIREVLRRPEKGRPGWRWEPVDPALLEDIAAVAQAVPTGTGEWCEAPGPRRRALALWALLSLDEDDQSDPQHFVPPELRAAVALRRQQAAAGGRDIDRQVIEGRYGWIDAAAPEFTSAGAPRASATERIDRLLLNPWAGFVLFLTLMTLVFQSLFAWADPLISLVERGVGWVKALAAAVLPAGLPASFLEDGVIEGVGAFLVFLPQILLLFLFIGILEDTGYMARVAVIMDRVMKLAGLTGRAFVPMLSGFACAVPAILATRNMERSRDRILTMMVVPLMTCSARLPVYGLLVAALLPPGGSRPWTQGLILTALYLFGVAAALVVSFVLGRTMLKAPPVPLLIELPPYRLPHWPSIAGMLWRQACAFVVKAGSVILLCSIAMWVLLSFPRGGPHVAEFAARRAALLAAEEAGGTAAAEPGAALRALELEEQAARARHSIAGRIGHAIEPVLEPLGFDWTIGVGIVSAFAAREVFVSTMGVVYGLGEVEEEGNDALRQRLGRATWPDGRKLFTPLACLSLLLFFALACQCLSTLAVVKQETGGWRWPAFLFGYMTALAWLASFLCFQGGRLLGLA